MYFKEKINLSVKTSNKQYTESKVCAKQQVADDTLTYL